MYLLFGVTMTIANSSMITWGPCYPPSTTVDWDKAMTKYANTTEYHPVKRHSTYNRTRMIFPTIANQDSSLSGKESVEHPACIITLVDIREYWRLPKNKFITLKYVNMRQSSTTFKMLYSPFPLMYSIITSIP